MRGRFGAADMYVPSMDLIIQVDGEHHAAAEQLERDGRFNDAAAAQQRRLLRLWHADIAVFREEILAVVSMCLTSPDGMVRHSALHPVRVQQV